MLTPKCDPFPPIQRVKGQYPWESAKHCSQSGKHYTQGRTQSASNVQRVYAEYMPVHPLYTHCSHVYYWRVHRVYRWYTRDTQIYREESVHRYTQIYKECIDYVQRGERECAHLYGGVYVINALIKPPFCTQMIYSKRHREYIEGVQRVQKICQESIYTCIGYNYRREALTGSPKVERVSGSCAYTIFPLSIILCMKIQTTRLSHKTTWIHEFLEQTNIFRLGSKRVSSKLKKFSVTLMFFFCSVSWGPHTMMEHYYYKIVSLSVLVYRLYM